MASKRASRKAKAMKAKVEVVVAINPKNPVCRLMKNIWLVRK